MAARARRLKFPLADVELFSLGRTSKTSNKGGNHQPL
jgi:hypothetical protein